MYHLDKQGVCETDEGLLLSAALGFVALALVNLCGAYTGCWCL